MKRYSGPILLVSLLLLLMAACNTAPAPEMAPAPELEIAASNQVCPNTGTGDPAWTKFDHEEGDERGDWGWFNYANTTLNYNINGGYTIELCLKSGVQVGSEFPKREFHTLVGQTSGNLTIAQQFSHVSWRLLVGEQPPLNDLEVSKTATGLYDIPVAWTLEKEVASGHVAADADVAWVKLLPFSGALGDQFNWTFRVIATRVEGDATNYRVFGDITITNSNAIPVEVTLADKLKDADGVEITVDVYCDGETEPNVGTVPAKLESGDGELVCIYEAEVENGDAVLNYVLVTPDHERLNPVSDNADIEYDFDKYTGDTEVQLTDEANAYDKAITKDTTLTFEDSFTCSTELAQYDGSGKCFKEFPNVATLTGDETNLSANARVEITCQLPRIPNGYTIGYWSNKNGESVLQRNDPAWRTLLNELYLVNPNGTRFTVPTGGKNGFSTAYGAFRTWLNNAEATNMSYMLSVQLAASRLNVAYMAMPNATVVHPLDSSRTITLTELFTEASNFLMNNRVTTTSGAARMTAEHYKNFFDNLNNNMIYGYY